MQYQKPVEKLLSTQMSRREFIGFMGAASLTAVGVAGLIKGLHGVASRHVNAGYGASAYGGGSESLRRKVV